MTHADARKLLGIWFHEQTKAHDLSRSVSKVREDMQPSQGQDLLDRASAQHRTADVLLADIVNRLSQWCSIPVPLHVPTPCHEQFVVVCDVNSVMHRAAALEYVTAITRNGYKCRMYRLGEELPVTLAPSPAFLHNNG